MQNGQVDNAMVSPRIQQAIDGINQPDGPAYNRAMYVFNERANELTDRIVSSGGNASENDMADLNRLLEFFANENLDGESAILFETSLPSEIMGALSPSQRAMWAFACHALASRRRAGSDA